MPEFSEFHITKVSDASTPLLFSGDAFVFDGTKAGGDVQPYMEWKLKEVLISGVIENGDTAVDPNNPNVDDGGIVIEGSRPMESLDDGGIIIEGGFPTETIRPTESVDDGGMIIYGFPTETVSPTDSLDDGGIIIIGGFPTETIRPIESVHHFELLI
jgi:Type VI secretion system effector, Hcp